MLKPNIGIQRFIFSSPVKFYGEYNSDTLNISIMFDRDISSAFNTSQNFYMASILTEYKVPDGEIVWVFPDYSYYSDVICMCISVLYGKAVYNHGFIEEHGGFRCPDMNIPHIADYEKNIYSGKVRKDLEIPFNLAEISRVAQLFEMMDDNKRYKSFLNAARFYWRALRNMEKEPELAFIDLVSCGESLTSGYDFSEDVLIKHDEQLCQIIDLIEKEDIDLKTKKKLCGFMRQRLFQVKRKYVLTICNSLNEYFFSNTESISDGNIGKIKHDNIEKNIRCTYDLRSKYVHEGLYLGHSLKELRNWKNETEILASINDEKNQKNTLTLHGLERVMRYCLLVYIHNRLNIFIDDRLQANSSTLI